MAHERWLRRVSVLLFLAWMMFGSAAGAVEVTDNLDLGGAIRARVDSDSSRNLHEFGIDTVMLSAKYTSDDWIGAARYRFYGKDYPYQYTRHFGEISFLEYAWVGYRFNPQQQVQVGLNRVPFGLMPFFSSTFYETLGFVMGLEDVDEVGIKYVQTSDDWNFQGGYYLRPMWNGSGPSQGDTYSSVVALPDPGVIGGSRNQERDMAVARLARNLAVGEWQTEIGASALISSLYNLDTHRDGRRYAYAVHYAASKGPWGVKLLAGRQIASPQNPGSHQTITIGGYDGTYNMAGRGSLYNADLSYAIGGSYLGGWISDVKLYGDYGLFRKSDPQFRDTQRFILGTSFSVKALSIYMEWLNGRNDPYFGGSSYTQSLAAGGTNHWRGQFFMDVGYYF